MKNSAGVSNAFSVFLTQAPAHAKVWMSAVHGLDGAGVLGKKTAELAYLAVLAAAGMVSGVPFHAASARQAGATREEVISAILVGLPAVGHGVVQSLPAAIAAYEVE